MVVVREGAEEDEEEAEKVARSAAISGRSSELMRRTPMSRE